VSSGRLWLVPNALDHGAPPVELTRVLPTGVIAQAASLGHWVVEDARSARAFLKRVHAVQPLRLALQAIEIRELPPPAKGGRAVPDAGVVEALLAPARAGHELGLLSEAGLPAVADPGAALVAAAHAAGIAVVPLPGASSLLLALAASGLNGQSFAFAGYLPQDAAARLARIRDLQATSRRLAQTQLLIETPYRNSVVLGALLEGLDAATRLSVSCGLTLPEGWTRTDRVTRWRERPATLPERVPAVFCFLAG
jgi:16S rRNA (cytidine1402-2'-O)-methyltransferase